MSGGCTENRVDGHEKFLRIVFCRKIQHLLHRDGLRKRKASGPCPAQGRHTAAAAERAAQIVAERAHIRPLGAADAKNILRPLPFQQLQLVDGDAAGLPLDLFAPAGQLIELLAADFNGGIHGRDLLDGAEEALERGLHILPRDGHGMRFEDSPARVLRVGHNAEAKACDVFLFR